MFCVCCQCRLTWTFKARLKGFAAASSAGDSWNGNHSRSSTSLGLVRFRGQEASGTGEGRSPQGGAVPGSSADPACSSSAPSGVSTCITAPPWRRVMMRPARAAPPRAGWPPRGDAGPAGQLGGRAPSAMLAAPPPGSGRPGRPAPIPGRRPTGARRPRPPRAGSAAASRPCGSILEQARVLADEDRGNQHDTPAAQLHLHVVRHTDLKDRRPPADPRTLQRGEQRPGPAPASVRWRVACSACRQARMRGQNGRTSSQYAACAASASSGRRPASAMPTPARGQPVPPVGARHLHQQVLARQRAAPAGPARSSPSRR